MPKKYEKLPDGKRKWAAPRQRRCMGCKHLFRGQFTRHANECKVAWVGWKQWQPDGTWEQLEGKYLDLDTVQVLTPLELS